MNDYSFLAKPLGITEGNPPFYNHPANKRDFCFQLAE